MSEGWSRVETPRGQCSLLYSFVAVHGAEQGSKQAEASRQVCALNTTLLEGRNSWFNSNNSFFVF